MPDVLPLRAESRRGFLVFPASPCPACRAVKNISTVYKRVGRYATTRHDCGRCGSSWYSDLSILGGQEV
jgi:hypothetical protein